MQLLELVLIFTVQFAFLGSMETRYFTYNQSQNYLTQFNFEEAVFIFWLSAVPSSIGFSWLIYLILGIFCKKKLPYPASGTGSRAYRNALARYDQEDDSNYLKEDKFELDVNRL